MALLIRPYPAQSDYSPQVENAIIGCNQSRSFVKEAMDNLSQSSTGANSGASDSHALGSVAQARKCQLDSGQLFVNINGSIDDLLDKREGCVERCGNLPNHEELIDFPALNGACFETDQRESRVDQVIASAEAQKDVVADLVFQCETRFHALCVEDTEGCKHVARTVDSVELASTMAVVRREVAENQQEKAPSGGVTTAREHYVAKAFVGAVDGAVEGGAEKLEEIFGGSESDGEGESDTKGNSISIGGMGETLKNGASAVGGMISDGVKKVGETNTSGTLGLIMNQRLQNEQAKKQRRAAAAQMAAANKDLQKSLAVNKSLLINQKNPASKTRPLDTGLTGVGSRGIAKQGASSGKVLTSSQGAGGEAVDKSGGGAGQVDAGTSRALASVNRSNSGTSFGGGGGAQTAVPRRNPPQNTGGGSSFAKYLNAGAQFFSSSAKAVGAKLGIQRERAAAKPNGVKSIAAVGGQDSNRAGVMAVQKHWNKLMMRVIDGPPPGQRGVASASTSGTVERDASIFRGVCLRYSKFRDEAHPSGGYTACPKR